MYSFNYLLSDINNIKGIGSKTAKLFKKKNINRVIDLLYSLPRDTMDRSNLKKINELQIGKIETLIVNVKKYNFPRIRNLPNRVNCLSSGKKIDCIFFNSYEGYIKKILPIDKEVIIFGKISYYKSKYQITNPRLVSETESGELKDIKKYSVTDGLTISKYNKIVEIVLKGMPFLREWHDKSILKKFNNVTWNDSIKKLHSEDFEILKNSFYLKRLILDEIIANFLLSSQIRQKILKI